MAGITRQSRGVVGGSDLRKCFRFGGVGLVAADAQHGRVEFRGLDGTRVLDMFCLGSVARFAVDVRMAAAFLFLQDIGMAIFASLVAGKVHRTSSDLSEGIPAIVSVLSETLRHQKRPYSHKHQTADHENGGQPKQVPGIFEGSHSNTALTSYSSGCQTAVRRITDGSVPGYR